MCLANSYSEIKQKRCEELKKEIESKIAQGFLPNIKEMEKMVRKLKRKMSNLEFGSYFAPSLELVTKIDDVLAKLDGEIAAYRHFIDKYYQSLEEQ